MTQNATTPTPLEALNATLGVSPPTPEAQAASGHAFYEALDHLESEGHALLSSAEGFEQAGHTILEIGEHTLAPAAAAPHTLEHAQALPLAMPNDILHKSEAAIVHAFLDVDDVIRNVYLNVRGLWVKQ